MHPASPSAAIATRASNARRGPLAGEQPAHRCQAQCADLCRRRMTSARRLWHKQPEGLPCVVGGVGAGGGDTGQREPVVRRASRPSKTYWSPVTTVNATAIQRRVSATPGYGSSGAHRSCQRHALHERLVLRRPSGRYREPASGPVTAVDHDRDLPHGDDRHRQQREPAQVDEGEADQQYHDLVSQRVEERPELRGTGSAGQRPVDHVGQPEETTRWRTSTTTGFVPPPGSPAPGPSRNGTP